MGRLLEIARRSAGSVPKVGAAVLLANVYDRIKEGDSVQSLTAAVRALIDACDLPRGYSDPSDPLAATALDTLRDTMYEKCRLTKTISAMIDSHATQAHVLKGEGRL